MKEATRYQIVHMIQQGEVAEADRQLCGVHPRLLEEGLDPQLEVWAHPGERPGDVAHQEAPLEASP
jgi:hypothetical protein